MNMNTTTHHVLACALLAFGAAHASAQTALTDGHVDLGVAFEEGALHLHWHDEENEIEYAPDEAYAFVPASSTVMRPAGASWDFTGTVAGGTLWLAPATQQSGVIFLGIGAEEIGPTDVDGGTLTLSLTGFSGPGQFALWQTDSFGQPIVGFSTVDGVDASDSITLSAGSHAHYNWGFTATGSYTLTFEASALVGGVPVGDTAQMQFGVATAVPEPATWATLAGALALGAAVWRRRRRAN